MVSELFLLTTETKTNKHTTETQTLTASGACAAGEQTSWGETLSRLQPRLRKEWQRHGELFLHQKRRARKTSKTINALTAVAAPGARAEGPAVDAAVAVDREMRIPWAQSKKDIQKRSSALTSTFAWMRTEIKFMNQKLAK
jgi:hypothetical protein